MKAIVRLIWTSLMLVLVGVFTSATVLSQSTNGGGAAPAAVEPQQPGTFVPEEVPTTLAKALEYAASVSYGFRVRIMTPTKGVELMVPKKGSKGTTLEQEFRQVAQTAAITEVLSRDEDHTIFVSVLDYWGITTQFYMRPLRYRHDGKVGVIRAEQVGSTLEFVSSVEINGSQDVLFPGLIGAGIYGVRIGTGAPVNMVATPIGVVPDSKFYVASVAGGVSHVGIPILESIRGELVLTNRFQEVHHFELPSGRFVETTVDRSLSIATIAAEPGKIRVTVRGKVGETIQIFSGPSPEYTVRQLLPDRNLFIQPGGTFWFKADITGEASFFKVLHFSSQEEAQRSLKR